MLLYLIERLALELSYGSPFSKSKHAFSLCVPGQALWQGEKSKAEQLKRLLVSFNCQKQLHKLSVVKKYL